jgi:hypothetical protein
LGSDPDVDRHQLSLASSGATVLEAAAAQVVVELPKHEARQRAVLLAQMWLELGPVKLDDLVSRVRSGR